MHARLVQSKFLLVLLSLVWSLEVFPWPEQETNLYSVKFWDPDYQNKQLKEKQSHTNIHKNIHELIYLHLHLQTQKIMLGDIGIISRAYGSQNLVLGRRGPKNFPSCSSTWHYTIR